MTNTLELKSLIIKNGFTQQSIAKEIGMSFAAFNMKLHNKRQFKSKEICAICKLLNIDNANNIFFA